MLMETPDEDLAFAAASGDRDAFAALLTRHYDRIFSLSYRLLGTRADAQDLTQDICTALPTKLLGWRGEARFSTWLYRVIVNATHDFRRRRATYSKATAGWGDWEIARQDQIEADRAAVDWLSQTMTRLPTDLRDTAALILGGDLTQAEAARVLELSEGTVAWRMSELKKRLRAIAAKEATQ